MSHTVRNLKGARKITALTVYDYSMAQWVSRAGVDLLLVGDSLGMVLYGDPSTHFVTLDEMIRHTRAVVRGHTAGLVVADMPVGTCDTDEDAVRNVRRLVEETGVRAVKIEGNPEVCRAVVQSGVEVMGHTGLKPQTALALKVHGRNSVEAEAIADEAKALEAAGCFAVVLECVPLMLAQTITSQVTIPTIGIGAGPYCDGQILVSYDMLGLFTDFQPPFVKRYAALGETLLAAVNVFKDEVENGTFPSAAESY